MSSNLLNSKAFKSCTLKGGGGANFPLQTAWGRGYFPLYYNLYLYYKLQTSLVPRPHPLVRRREKGLVDIVHFLKFADSAILDFLRANQNVSM